nr:MAG TPA: hypothetical protein [Caudoviricetes sp.]
MIIFLMALITSACLFPNFSATCKLSHTASSLRR